MAHVIVLEGPDGAGKSTLGNTLAERLWVDVKHDGGPSRDREHALERINAFVNFEDALRDRSTLFSDAVYKRALGGDPFVSDDELRPYVEAAASRGTLMVYCRPSLDVIIRNTEFLARAKAHKPPEYVEQVKRNLPAIVEEYDQAVIKWASWGLPIIQYDFTKTQIQKFCDLIRSEYWEKNR